jgi:hypothetical protein
MTERLKERGLNEVEGAKVGSTEGAEVGKEKGEEKGGKCREGGGRRESQTGRTLQESRCSQRW